jgi:LacI family transcriptional regulator
MVVTAQMVAQRAGVSQGVVSKVLHGSTGNIRMSQDTAERVRQAAQELGYRPNGAARAMRKGRFNAIGLLFASRINEAALNPLAMWAIQKQMMERNHHLTMAPLPDEKLVQEGAVPHVLKDWSVDGLLVSYTYNSPEPLVQMLAKHRVSAIWMNRKMAADCVYLDDYTSASWATQELLRHGHKRITYVSFRPVGGHYSAADRQAGYEQAMASAGLGTDLFVMPPEHNKDGLQLPFLLKWLQRPDRPTGIFTYGDAEAAILLMAAARLGIRVPEDLSITSVLNSTVPVAGVRISGAEVRHVQMGERAVELLLKRIDDPSTPLDPVAVAPRLVEGDTAGPVNPAA